MIYSFCQVTIITKIAIYTTAKRDTNALQKAGGTKHTLSTQFQKVGRICPCVHPTIDAHDADDVQAYVHGPPSQFLDITSSIASLAAGLDSWMSFNRLSLNPSKTQLIWPGNIYLN